MASIDMMDAYTESGSSPGTLEDESRRSWSQLRQSVRKSHRAASSLLSRMPHSFTFRRLDSGDRPTRLYFLGVQAGQRDHTLLYVDIDADPSGGESLESATPADVKCLLEAFQTSSLPYGKLSKEEQLLRERKRLRSFGIMSYDYHEERSRFVFPACNSLFCCDDTSANGGFSKEPLFPKEIQSSCSGSKLDPKICPSNADIVAFISSSDIWVSNITAGVDSRVTFAHNGASSMVNDPKSAGIPSFVVQEEFDRYTGYWWQPEIHQTADGQRVYRILYEEVDESDVQILNIVSPQSDGTGIDEYRYPRAGTSNAKSTLRLLEFQIDDDGAISGLRDLQLPEPLNSLFPWSEYLLRAGWTPDGKHAYAVLIDRVQQKLQIVLLSPDCFCLVEGAVNGDEPMSVGYLTTLTDNIHVIYEDTSDVWLHVHDLLHFFPQESSQQISFIYASEKSGFLHLYQVTSSLEKVSEDLGIAGSKPQSEEIQLTLGDWQVDSKQIWVDAERSLVYFLGYLDTPLESHLYVVPLNQPGAVTRLTELDCSHSVSMDKNCRLFATVYSNLKNTPSCDVHRIVDDSFVQNTRIAKLLESSALSDYRPPELFQYPSSSGFTMYGLVYKPPDFEPTKTYPTFVFVYAGPQVQLVSNTYKGMRFLRLHTLASLGYVVLVIDSRGSCHRGLKFESHIRHRLGQVEVADQVEGLQWLAENGGYIDMDRVAIHGWSYGGYVSLLALCQRPDIFKLAIAGAPVTSWELYDTGYTERYMGLPATNPDAYSLGSVLRQVDNLPSQENRLLIVHGLIDENVHFYHTSALINALVKACKPYNLQVYPNERHGIRNPDANEHYEAMLLSYLQQHL